MEIGSTETAKSTKNAKAGSWGNGNNPESKLSVETAKSTKNAKAGSWQKQ